MENKKMSAKEIFELEADLQRNAAGRRITRSTHGRLQQRSTGARAVKNLFSHAVGTIGGDIDRIIRHPSLSGRYSKGEMAALCGTKTSKINSHLNNELSKKLGLVYKVDENGKLAWEWPAGSRGKALLSTTRNYRFK
jgi:hypothetical protein